MNYTKTLAIGFAVVIIFLIGSFFYVYYAPTSKIEMTASAEDQANRVEILNQFNTNNLDGAITAAQKMTQDKSTLKSVLAFLQLANAYVQKANFATSAVDQKEYGDKALDAARQVLLVDPQNEEAYRVTGYAYEVMQDFPNAEKNYTKALELNPKFDLALSNRGHLYELMGNREKAFADYNDAYAMNPSNDFTQLNLGRYYFTAGQNDQAIPFLHGAIQSSQNIRVRATAHEVLGNIYFSTGSSSKALSEFNASIATDASYPDSYFDRAFLALASEDKENALGATSTHTAIIEDIRQGLTLNPAKAFGYFLMGITNYSTDKTKAVENYEKALTLVDADVTVIGENKKILKQDIKVQLDEALKK